MNDILHYALPVYFLVYFGIAFVWQSVVVAKRTGRNPIVLPRDESAYGLVGFYFKLIIVAIFIYLFLYAFFPGGYPYFLPIRFLEHRALPFTGLILLLLVLPWTIIAQRQMKHSWRIGIDTEVRTPLITQGLFSISRNPIFLGMILSLLGLFLATPNALTLIFLLLGYVLIQVQIRLEEEFLARSHGQDYRAYAKKVRRLI